LVRIILCWA